MAFTEGSAAPLLTEAMLEALAARWREQGAAIADDLRPGLAEAEMQAAAEPFGLALPAEVRVWWGWHDGTASTTGTSALGLDLLLPPAVESHRRLSNPGSDRRAGR
jgi:cell wall assembly regulator SMI1